MTFLNNKRSYTRSDQPSIAFAFNPFSLHGTAVYSTFETSVTHRHHSMDFIDIDSLENQGVSTTKH
jgi:hypothetical protein